MGYSLVDDGWWPADIRNRIVAAMDEAVAIYNAHGSFNTWVYVQYHPGVPTAEANYPDYLKFGGSISTQVALHEISHTLGTGTTWQWNGQFGGDVWNGAKAKHYVKLFDGPGAELRKSGVHYYPYGLNYASEDNPQARIRLVKMVSAMRADMAIDGAADSDGDGLPNEWEMWRFGNLSQTGTGDTDGDGISNLDEYYTEGDPLRPCPVKDGHTYLIRAKHSQKYLEAAGTNAGAVTRQNAASGNDLQKWTASYRGGGYWKFTNVASGKVLETAGASWDAGADIIQWNDLGNDSQKWRLVPDGQVYSKIFNGGSRNMVIDVDGGTGATGNLVPVSQYYDVLGGTNQDWAFDDVTPGFNGNGLRAEYKLEGSARDNGGAQYHGSVAGGVTYASGRVDGQAATFNGTNGTIQVPSTVDRSFTIACWVRTTATAGSGTQWYQGMGLVDGEVPGVAADFGLSMVSNRAAFGIGGADTTILSTVGINNGAWHHLASTYNASNGAMRLYVDGIQRGSATGPVGARTAPTSLYLGSIRGAGGFFNGSMDEVRIYDSALPATDIARLATVGQTCVASYGFDNDLQDASQHGNHGTASGSTPLAYAAGKTGISALQLDGATNFATLPASVTNDFSVACWVKTTATGGTGQWYNGKAIVDAEVAGAASDWGIALLGNKAAFGVGNADKTISSTTAINDGNWHHIAVTRANSSGAMRLYVDGMLEASDTGPSGFRSAPHALNLGRSLNGGAWFAGAIDELRAFNYVLSNTELASLGSPALPAAWTALDLGNPGSDGYTGHAAANGGTFTVTGGGTGMTTTGDQLHFVSRPLSGDGGLVVRLTGTPESNSGAALTTARAGLSLRASTASNASGIEFTYDQNSGLSLRHRASSGGAVTGVPLGVTPAAPVWLRLARHGSLVSASYASTPEAPAEGDWQWAGFQTLDLPASTMLGMIVAPTNANTVATAAFDRVSTVASPDGAQAAAWRISHFGSAADSGNAADGADPDGDGVSNVFERAYGTSPTVRNAPGEGPVSAAEGGYLVLRYPRSAGVLAGDLNLTAQWNIGLAAPWSSEGVEDSLESTGADGIQHRADRVPLANFPGGRGFMRLRVEP